MATLAETKIVDPVIEAIEAHESAWLAFQVAPDGDPSLEAEDAMEAALVDLVATPCRTRPGAFAMLRHLRWWLTEEQDYAKSYQPEYGIAQAREADLTMLLGCEADQNIHWSIAHLLPKAPAAGLLQQQGAAA